MLVWIKEHWQALVIGLLGMLAALAAASARRERVKEWQERAIGEVEAQVDDELGSANAALDRAEGHKKKARLAEKKAQARLDEMGARDESMADIVDSWRRPDRLRDDADS